MTIKYTKIVTEKEKDIVILSSKQHFVPKIEQDGNTIYIPMDKIQEVIKGLQKIE